MAAWSGTLAELDDLDTEYARAAPFKGNKMTEDHKPLPVAGYTPQPDAKVALVNEFKADEERLLRKLDAHVLRPGTANSDVNTVTPTGPLDQRWLAVARTHFHEGFMALNRAVFQPQRIALPEDDAK